MKVLNSLKQSKFFLDFFSVFSSNGVLLLLGVLSSVVISRSLGPSGMGVYSILTNFSLVFISFAELGIRQSSIYYAAKGFYDTNSIFSANFIIWVFSSIIGISAFLLIINVKDLEADYLLLLFALLVIPFSIANTFINGIMMGADKIRKSANYNFINGIFKVALIALLLIVLKLGVLGALIALVIPTITLFARKYNYLHKTIGLKLKLAFNLEIIKKLIGHGFLYGFALFLITNQKKVPIFVMAGNLSAHDVGIYSAGMSFSSLLYNLYGALAPIIFLKSAKTKDPVANSYKIQKLMRVMFVLLTLISCILYFALKIIVPIMYGEKFAESIPITRILLIGIIFFNVFLILNMDMAGRGKPWIAIYTLIPVTILNFTLNYYFIGLMGNIGAAFSTTLAMVIAACAYLYFYAKELGLTVMDIISPRKSDWEFIYKLLGK